MVDITITPTSVVAGSNAKIVHGTAGVAITAGQLVVKDAVTGKYVQSDTNHATLTLREPTGVALNGAAINQPVAVMENGDITIGATLVAGTDYWASDTPGGICPRADVGATERVVQVGIAKTTSVLGVAFQRPGVNL